MSLWDWCMNDIQAAYERVDEDRIAMVKGIEEAAPLVTTNPDLALALIDQSYAVARRLNDGWWMRFYEHYRIQLLMLCKRDYQAALDLSVRATLEVRKPGYEQLPQRVCLHEDLIRAYAGIDPIGHEQRIRQALDYMQREISPTVECRYCLQSLRVAFEAELGRFDQALEAGLEALAATQREPVQLLLVYTLLCAVAHARGDWENLLGWAVAGEELAGDRTLAIFLVELLAWQAVCRRRAGDEEAARRLYRRATSRAGRLPMVPGPAYFDAICAYHELSGDYQRSLAVRGRQLATLDGTGQLHHTALCHLQRCRLLRLLGRRLDAALDEARAAITLLAEPAPLLARLAELTA
jgi:hypothetical protein